MNRVLTLLSLSTAAMPAAAAAGSDPSSGGVLLPALALLLLCAWLLHRFSGAVVLRLFRAQPASAAAYPELHRLNRELSQRAGLTPPRLFLLESETPNAFATGRGERTAAVAVTRGLLRLLNEQELAGVLAHELAHLHQRREAGPFSGAALSGSTALLAGVVRSALVFSAGRRGLAFTLISAPLSAFAAALGRHAAGGSRELAADAMGAKLCGDPLWLAAALRKIRAAENPAGAAPGPLASHPAVEERIQRLEAMAYGAYV